MPDPTKPPPTEVVGLRTRFHGGSGTGDHPYLLGHDVVVIGVLKGALTSPNGEHGYITDDDALGAAGGLDFATDKLDVAPFVSDENVEGGERPSFASSDVLCTDLLAFAPAPAAVARVEPVAATAPEKTAEDYEKLRLVHQLDGTIQRATGKMYRIALDKIDAASLREFVRLMRDLEYDKDSAVRKARMEPWRR